ncbi:uncharacterized protein PFL1_05445 [Pseudozyma flocculosa PF-1]|uniref:Coenzyme Q-binding protein COQ10 START domain-containing protein n=2 Tax=Pseudozyma flocculosa TaxID=84751 RepID=A0A5C3FCQ5_9BASI|nr:uncharacterized protein PFL1_05445 [Pseudozyma flocculosa PF-1]EPQ27164.1 hypothetical protein PFL1_05445 [Pseudozyma flocculosa PF-1]SPO41251.1 uncharacterized protein PSFLO_06733 [Pseudozyma flocculosa]
MALQHTLLIVGGSGFLGSAISKQALAKGWKVISISPSGKPYLSPAGHRPSWSSSPNISWHAADALDPASYSHLAAQCTAAVHTVGILLEADYKPKDKGLLGVIGGALQGVAKGWGYAGPSSQNPLQDDRTSGKRRQMSYEVMNRDSAVSVAHTFLSALQKRQAERGSTSDPPSPAPFVYISAEDLFRPVVDARYITTKRQAEKMITRLSEQYGQALVRRAPAGSSGRAAPAEFLDADGAGLSLELQDEAASSSASVEVGAAAAADSLPVELLRPVFMRPGLMYEPHKRPLSTLPAAILEASAAFHKSPPLPLPLPTPASLLSSAYTPASLRPLAKLLTTPPLHIDTVAKAVCKAIEDDAIRGPIDPLQIRRLAGWREEGGAAAAKAAAAEVDPAHLVHPSHRPGAPDPAAAATAARKLDSGNPFAATTQPHHRRFSSVAGRRTQRSLSPSHRRRSFFSLPDLGKLASSTINAATGSGDGASGHTDEHGRQVYETQRILSHSVPLLYRVVSDVDAYEHFVPYCQSSTVLGDEPRFKAAAERGEAASDGADTAVLADLSVGFGSFQERYTSQVRMKKDAWVSAEAVQPNPIFKHLSTVWTFEPIASPSSPGAPEKTQVTFRLCYAFRNPLYATVAGGVFERMSAQMMHAFQQRAREVAAASA